MKYSFLREFPRRMKVVSMYAVLLGNSGQKQKWKEAGFETEAEQINIIFSVLLFIMEQSLKEENCTIDDVGVFIDDINTSFFHKNLTLNDCNSLADFIVNIVLSNGGLQMNFDGYDYDKKQYNNIFISYVANKVVYDNLDNRRTSYYLTENGYSLLLGTLEVENNMRLTIQEIIFNEHLKKRNFDKALDDIKNIFELMRIEKLKNDEAVSRIKQNVLNFSLEEYGKRMDDSLSTIKETRAKLEKYKSIINDRVKIIENENIDLDHISGSENTKLDKLREISRYLDRSIECHVDIIKSYHSYREVCAKEMEYFLQISQVERFSFSREIFDKILEDATRLDEINVFLHPLFLRKPEKSFNLNKVFVPQHLRSEVEDEEDFAQVVVEQEKWRKEQEQLRAEKNALYRDCLLFLLECTIPFQQTTLSEIQEMVALNPDKQRRLIPTLSIFKEVIIDLIRTRVFTVLEIRENLAKQVQTEENAESLEDLGEAYAKSDGLQITDLFLSLVESTATLKDLKSFSVTKLPASHEVVFSHIADGEQYKRLICTDLKFSVVL